MIPAAFAGGSFGLVNLGTVDGVTPVHSGRIVSFFFLIKNLSILSCTKLIKIKQYPLH